VQQIRIDVLREAIKEIGAGAFLEEAIEALRQEAAVAKQRNKDGAKRPHYFIGSMYLSRLASEIDATVDFDSYVKETRRLWKEFKERYDWKEEVQ